MIAILRLSAGLIGWAAAFCLVYALHGIGCASGWYAARLGPFDAQRAALLAAWALSLAATLAIALWLHRTRATKLDRAAAATGWVGFAATLITFLPVIGVPSCL